LLFRPKERHEVNIARFRLRPAESFAEHVLSRCGDIGAQSAAANVVDEVFAAQLEYKY
jgi:hypothetical protein